MKKIEPIVNAIKAESHTPQYKMHKYFARRPHNVFSHLIEHYSDEEDIILDVFCGGGVTIFESVAQNRRSIGVDLNPLATFISKMQIYNGNLPDSKKRINDFVDEINSKYGKYYDINFENDTGTIEWIEWAYIISCPHCGCNIELTEKNKIRNGIYRCSNNLCAGFSGVKRTSGSPNGSIPLRVKYLSSKTGSSITRVLSPIESKQIQSDEKKYNDLRGLIYPKIDIPSDMDRQFEDKLTEKGILSYSDFFTKRNFRILSLIFTDIMRLKGNIPDDYIDELYFVFSSSLRYTNKMSRVTENWENGNPTSMDKHAFWLPNEYIEQNVINVMKDRAKSIIKGFTYSHTKVSSELKHYDSFDKLQNSNKGFMLLNQSSTSLPIFDNSIDVIITDPPYGSNVQYAELSIIWNSWYQLYAKKSDYMYRDLEAVSNRKSGYVGAKTEKDYEKLLTDIFKESYRVLKQNAYMVFTFNNKNIKVWLAMIKAAANAGFFLPENGILFQDYIQSYKNTSHLRFSGNITGDFIYSFQKSSVDNIKESNYSSVGQLIEDAVGTVLDSIVILDNQITNVDLYKLIFSKLSFLLTKHIIYCHANKITLAGMSTFSDDYIDKIIEKRMDYLDGKWVLKKYGN